MSLDDGMEGDTIISFDEVVGLSNSLLPSVSFSSTSSPPEFQAVQWMTQTDKDMERLSDDRLVQRFVMASIGCNILGFNNWAYL